MKIGVLNTTFFLKDSIQIEPGGLTFQNNRIYDPHAIEKAVIICDGNEIPGALFQLNRGTNVSRSSETVPGQSTLEEMERKMILKALEECEGNLSSVAARLGITRQTLYNKLKKFGI